MINIANIDYTPCAQLYSKHFHMYFSLVKFSRSVVSNSLQPHESQQARPPCPSQTPGVYSDSCPLSRWCHPAISSSVIPFSSCPESLPASGSFPMSQLFASGGQSTGFSVSASVLPMNTQDWSPLGWTGWISLQSYVLEVLNLISSFPKYRKHWRDSLVVQMVKKLPAMQETWVWSLGQDDPREKEMAIHSSILAWRIPWTESLVGYSPWGLKESDTTEWRTHKHIPKKHWKQEAFISHLAANLTSGRFFMVFIKNHCTYCVSVCVT